MRIGKEIEITHDLSNGLCNQFLKEYSIKYLGALIEK